MKAGYLLLAVFSGIGLALSIACHALAWLRVEPPWGKSVFALHLGIFLVFIPLVIFANRTMPKPGRRDNVSHLLKELPTWARRATTAIFIYALLNFAYFIFVANQYPKHKIPFYLELRAFSGHWMLFYGLATAGFVGLARIAGKSRDNERIPPRRGNQPVTPAHWRYL